MHGLYYMATPEENKIRYNKNWLAMRSAKYSLVWPGRFLRYFVVAEKWKNIVWTCEATCKGSHGGRLAQCVSIAVGRGILLYILSQLGICENKVANLMYVARYRANKELVIL